MILEALHTSAVLVGDVIPQVSDELLQTADVMNMPLILIEDEAEYSVRYSDVIKDVIGAIFYGSGIYGFPFRHCGE